VNLHPNDLNDPQLFDPWSGLARLAPQVVLELTERERLGDDDQLRTRLSALRDLGYQIAIDDLGAGYASLNAVVAVRPEIVKLDQHLIRGIEADKCRLRLVRGLTATCQDLGAMVVAEGIETEAELDALLGIGVDLLQGYLLGRPAPGFRWSPAAHRPVGPSLDAAARRERARSKL
jgi:EAL domain-containing protein (putative c-di-GMP-specific phosphodiesterase class I)